LIPHGFKRCQTCGEFNGSTESLFLNWSDETDTQDLIEFFEMTPEERDDLKPVRDPSAIISVTCLCQGIPCRLCRQNLIHKPGSNTYEEKTNSVWHYPYFQGLVGCQECRMKKK
jgi:hypothetical protein